MDRDIYHTVTRNYGSYDDSFGSKDVSDYVDYGDFYKHNKHDGPKPRYTKRQTQIIENTLPDNVKGVCKHELKFILDKAYEYDDEDVITAILETYKEMLDEDVYDVPSVDDEEFLRTLMTQSRFGK